MINTAFSYAKYLALAGGNASHATAYFSNPANTYQYGYYTP